jgi:hypothetical protein
MFRAFPLRPGDVKNVLQCDLSEFCFEVPPGPHTPLRLSRPARHHKYRGCLGTEAEAKHSCCHHLDCCIPSFKSFYLLTLSAYEDRCSHNYNVTSFALDRVKSHLSSESCGLRPQKWVNASGLKYARLSLGEWTMLPFTTASFARNHPST